LSHEFSITTGRGCSTNVQVLGGGPPLIYLHGVFGFPERDFVEALAREFTVYVPTHPGFEGTSGLELIDASVFDLALHYDDVIEALDIPKPADIVGHSFGAVIASELAAIFPARVGNLGLISPLGIWLDEAPQPDLFGLTPGALARTVFHDPDCAAARELFIPPEDRREAAVWNRIRRRNAVGAAKFLWPLPDKGFRARAYRLRARSFLVWGENDNVVPPGAYAPAYQQLMGSEPPELIPDAGHMVPVEKPEETSRAVIACLNRTRLAQRTAR
jgi:pimeloyl-ACP methyl ester carboxylesterase